jgi:hypothetical protein
MSSPDAIFICFLKKLPQRERNFYILMKSYRQSLDELNKCDLSTMKDGFDVLSDCFEGEINRILENSKSAIYENQAMRNEDAEQSTSGKLNIIDDMQGLKFIDDQFDKKLGTWASSFSDEDDETLFQIDKQPILCKKISPR